MLDFNRAQPRKSWTDEYQIRGIIINENLKVRVFSDLNGDVAIIKERKTCFGWVADPPFSTPRQLLVFIISIENLPEVCTIQTDKCRQKPHRKDNFTSLRHHGTTQIGPCTIL